MAEPDDVMQRLGAALELVQAGDRATARARYQQLWDEIGPDGDPLHRCAVAHSMADVQDDPRHELVWDTRALEAAELLTDERVAAAGIAGSARSFEPSLHLNLADVHLRLGHRDQVAHHVAAGAATLDALADDGYRAMIAGALDRVADALDDM